MIEADKARLEKIKRDFPGWAVRLYAADQHTVDVSWLLTLVEAQEGEVDVVKFKLANVTTERDVANQEIERLKVQLQEEMTDYATALKEHTDQLTAERGKVKKLETAGFHAGRCSIVSYDRCDCGWEQALADTEVK